MLAALAHLVHRRRRAVVGIWVVLTLFGAFSAKQVSKRWFESFSIPGYSAYETNQKALHTFGTGEHERNLTTGRVGAIPPRAPGARERRRTAPRSARAPRPSPGAPVP